MLEIPLTHGLVALVERLATNPEVLEARSAEHEQTRADNRALRTALADLLQEPLTGYLGSRSVRIDVTLTPEKYASLRALLAEPGA